jgi:hypothetical protein
MDVRIIMMILMTIGGIVVGYQYGIGSKDCQQDYNRGYGNALYYASVQQQMDMSYNWINKSDHMGGWGVGGIGMANTSYYFMNMTMNMSDCYENETGYNSNDLVMHMTCKS